MGKGVGLNWKLFKPLFFQWAQARIVRKADGEVFVKLDKIGARYSCSKVQGG